MKKNEVVLGCGLIGIGRKWGAVETAIPDSEAAETFLNTAVTLGITFFDTAPAYGDSEEKLGEWLVKMSAEERDKLTIATKCGEYWVEEKGTTQVDHSYTALVTSIDRSLQKLGKIEVLQLHKATEGVLKSNDVDKALQYAQSHGVNSLGASVSTIEAGTVAIADGRYSFLQFPLNSQNQDLLPLVNLCIAANITPIINRPVNMGQSLLDKNKEFALKEAFNFLLGVLPFGIILTGTKNPEHLKENVQVFNSSKK